MARKEGRKARRRRALERLARWAEGMEKARARRDAAIRQNKIESRKLG